MKSLTSLLIIMLPTAAHAATATFEEFLPGTEITTGEQFSSGGLIFEVFTPDDAYVASSVVFSNSAGFPLTSGTYAALNNWDGLILHLSEPVTAISLEYFSGYSDLDLIINGVDYNAHAQLDFTAGGINVDFTPDGGPNFTDAGLIQITGPITSFAVSGTELVFDNFTVVVPEPTTLTLTLVVGLGHLLVTRCRYTV